MQSRKEAVESAQVANPQVDVIPAEVLKKPALLLKNAEVPAPPKKKPALIEPEKIAAFVKSAEVPTPDDEKSEVIEPESDAAAPLPEPQPQPASEPAEEKPAVVEPEKVAATPAPQSAPEPAPRPSIFVPLVLGGLVAGGIGFGIAKTTQTPVDRTLSAQIERQADVMGRLETEVESLSDSETAQTTEIETLMTGLADVEARLTALEALIQGEGVSSAPAIAAYEAELDALRAQISDMTGIAQTELDAARAEAAAIEENAAAAARAAAGRAALARLQTGMENGAPLGAALADLEEAIGGQAPDALLAAQDGVPTLASLQEQFPEVARAALATARSEGVSGEETSGIGAFLRNQFDVRSVTPQEGTSADAILSRAEDAVRAGRLSEALLEISALPEVARAAMSEWLGQAELRADAIAAVDILSTSLSDN